MTAHDLLDPTFWKHVSALITPAMLVLLGLSHGSLTVARAIRDHARKTASTADDKIADRLVAAAEWFEVIARAVAHAASAGILLRSEPETPTPHLEAVEAEDVENADPRGEP